MQVLISFLICILFLPGALGTAHADGTYELTQKRGLLVFEDFQHWANIKYSYGDHDSNQNGLKSTNASHVFQESYNALLAVAIYDPHIFDTTLQAGILFYQNSNRNSDASSSGNAATYQYHFSGVGLDRSSTPFTLLSYRDLNTIESTYSMPYTSENSGNELDFSIRNVMLPSRFHFAHTTIDISGGGYNSSSVSNSYAYSAEHAYKDFSATFLQLRFSDQTGHSSNGAEVGRTSNYLSFTNALSMDKQKKYSLLTSFQLDNSRTDKLPQRTINFSETLQTRPGKALALDAIYTLADSRGTDYAGLTQKSTLSRGEISLKHKLFSSLETTMRGTVSSNKINGGTEDRYGGIFGLRYVKLLPESGLLTAGVSKEYEQVDRKADSAATTIIEELHSAVHQGDVIDLPLGDGTLAAVISVKSRNPEFTYSNGIDYTVDIRFGRINIQAGSGVSIDMTGTGTDLYISYIVNKAAQIKYANNNLTATTDLSLLGNKLQIGASYIESNPTLISGTSLNNTLRTSRMMMAYAGSRHDRYDYRITFRDFMSDGHGYWSVEGTGRANWSSSSSAFSLTARNLYSKYDAYATDVGYGENMADVSLSYSRNILSNMKVNLMANVLDIRSDLKGASDSMSFRAVYKVVLNKTIITMSGKTVWSLYNKGTINREIRDDAVQVEISRNF